MSTEADFLHKVQAVFATSVAELDPRSIARLRQARSAALAAGATPRPLWRSRWTLSAGAAALVGAAVIASVVWLHSGPRPEVPFAAHSNEDMSIELSGDNLDMYADMDFYTWLQTQEPDASQAASGASSNG